MLGLDKFNQYLAVAKDARVELEKELSVLNNTRTDSLNQATRLQSEVASLQSDLVTRQATTTDSTGKQNEVKSRREAQLSALSAKRSSIEAAMTTARQSEQVAKEKESIIDISAAKDAIAELTMKEKHLRSLGSNPTDCPSCGQPISAQVRSNRSRCEFALITLLYAAYRKNLNRSKRLLGTNSSSILVSPIYN